MGTGKEEALVATATAAAFAGIVLSVGLRGGNRPGCTPRYLVIETKPWEPESGMPGGEISCLKGVADRL